ncbi:uncharacterized protein ARMOST_22161 [Armillaria ostoyae]|uniref:Uncharacterized protein n=1 Tax=Armillaria ostoyae TaxID=47428 RepID=A0A284SC35_ARMOS|nr:uncharacterized protein ARMOST_22161 [Armillaria ostoyae]
MKCSDYANTHSTRRQERHRLIAVDHMAFLLLRYSLSVALNTYSYTAVFPTVDSDGSFVSRTGVRTGSMGLSFEKFLVISGYWAVRCPKDYTTMAAVFQIRHNCDLEAFIKNPSLSWIFYDRPQDRLWGVFLSDSLFTQLIMPFVIRLN